jgi:hypothetical protein
MVNWPETYYATHDFGPKLYLAGIDIEPPGITQIAELTDDAPSPHAHLAEYEKIGFEAGHVFWKSDTSFAQADTYNYRFVQEHY